MRRGRRGGFTLLEMLLSVALIGVITASIMGGIHLGRRAWEAGRAAEAMSELDDAPRALERLFARAFPVTLPSEKTAPSVAFEGRSDFCRFIMISEGEANWGGLIDTQIGTAGDGPAQNLKVWTRVFRAPEWAAGGRDDALAAQAAADVAYFKLAYFGSPAENAPPAWNDSWTNRPGLPSLISARLGVRRGGRIIETSFVTALRQN